MRLVLDRIEKTQKGERIAIFECGNDQINISEENMPFGFIDKLNAGMIIEAQIVNNTLNSPKILYKETDEKQNEMNTRLSNLFNRNKK